MIQVIWAAAQSNTPGGLQKAEMFIIFLLLHISYNQNGKV